MHMLSGLVISVLFATTLAVDIAWYYFTNKFDKEAPIIGNANSKSILLVAIILYGIAALVTTMRMNKVVHRYILSGPIGNGVVMAHFTLSTFLISIVWFDAFNNMSMLDDEYKQLNYSALADLKIQTAALVLTYVVNGISTSANYINSGELHNVLSESKHEKHHHDRDFEASERGVVRARVVC